jgi:polysaccharide biosynthesis transport protein
MTVAHPQDRDAHSSRSFLDWLDQVRDGWIALVVCVGIGAGLGALATRSQDTAYRAAGTFVASPASGFLDPRYADAIPALTATVGRLAETSAVLAEMRRRWAASTKDPDSRAKRARLASVRWLRDNVKVRQVGQSAITEISATAPTDRQARDLAQAAVDSVASVVTSRRGSGPRRVGITVSVLRDIESRGRVSPTPLRNVLIGINAGLIVGILAALALGARRRRLREPDSVAREVGIPLLGIVPASRRMHLEDAPGLAAARARMQSMKSPESGLVVVVTGTTDSRDIARVGRGLLCSLGAASQRAVLVDADLKERRATQILDVEGRDGLSTMLDRNGTSASELTVAVTGLHNGRSPDLAVLPAGPKPSGERNLAAHRLVDVLSELRRIYSYVVIAGPPLSRLADVIWLTSAADCAIVVAAAGVPAKRLQAARFLSEAVDRPLAGALIVPARLKR